MTIDIFSKEPGPGINTFKHNSYRRKSAEQYYSNIITNKTEQDMNRSQKIVSVGVGAAAAELSYCKVKGINMAEYVE